MANRYTRIFDAGGIGSLIFLFNIFMNYSGFGRRYWDKMRNSLMEKLNFQAVIKSAASAASPIAWGEPGRRLRLAGDGFGALPKQSGRLR